LEECELEARNLVGLPFLKRRNISSAIAVTNVVPSFLDRTPALAFGSWDYDDPHGAGAVIGTATPRWCSFSSSHSSFRA
jgi:hypothetical protein